MGAIHHNQFTEELYKIIPKGMYLRDNSNKYSDDQTERTYRLYNKKHREIASFRARALPGCCGVLVVYYLRPAPCKRQEDSITVFRDTLEGIVQAAGMAKFGAVLLTQVVGSLGYNALCNNNNSLRFTNWKTDNTVATFQISTKRPEEPPKAATFEGE